MKGELVAVKRKCKTRHDEVTKIIREMGEVMEAKERAMKEPFF